MSHLTSFCNALSEKGFDAAILSAENTQRYLASFVYSDGYLLVTPKHAFLLTDFRYEEAAHKEADPAFEILCPTCGMGPAIAELLSEHGCRRVAVEEAELSLAALERLKKAMPDVSLESGASEILGDLMVHKDEAELAIMDRAQQITDAAFAHILGQITPNMTEMDVALELEFFMRRNGAEGTAFETIAVSGSASSLPHGVPRRTRLEQGFLTMDFGAVVDGYRSDMTRTVVIGHADAEMKHLYNTVLRAQTAALDAAAEGVGCAELDRIARDIIDAVPAYKGAFGHSLGHGVGLQIHESPRLSRVAKPDAKLERGHVVTFEPGIYLAGKYGCRIEDMVAVRNDGSIYNFTKSPKELIELL